MKPIENSTLYPNVRKGKAQAIPSEDVEQSLYAKRQKIYPRQVHGLFARLRITSVLTLLGIYYIFPWLQWDGRQAVLFDLPARQFYIGGWIFWPQDFIYLAFLLIIAGFSLFFFTTLAGRLWCGYACPQTAWTETFLWMERLVEGDRSRQMKLDKEPMSARKFRIKATKHGLWIGFSLITGFTFIGYFTPIRELMDNLIPYNLSGWETFWFFFYSAATYGNAGFMREQICIYMCPYSRFQSAMFDKDTLIIAYDAERGDPRGSRKKGEDYQAKNLGSCINCTMCVQVCPTGIDIRDGLQYQCIGCSACIDVCDDIMEKMNYPKGLIRYTTDHAIHGNKTHILRPRILVYATLLLTLFGLLIYSIAIRVPVQLDVMRDRNMLYRESNEGLIQNVYMLKLINKDIHPHQFTVTVNGLQNIQLEMDSTIIEVAGSSLLDLPVRVNVARDDIPEQSNTIEFTLAVEGQPDWTVTEDARFLGPLKRLR
ncbi:cytochrome c oxidase accessory protein CcoG [Beggiatoa leptomitoformis]|uniref:Cytochrome c oxidase accessory protein CcoG n=1 Tax=Beggiatoa leptomitoformis TaxID=288004 RepID=A0A2N9YED1_9GAMM|nr:cytochrome c oxidase accessory protein CcoG [Beggiatoa leptomitoformis]ALG68913.1 cytochrome c oxidase accessory protein CcoG [Beggiatoa leptomitoformis]AUI68709.1 cytochrome c oxidase accessory protein CcoG [Beggiatoa leptomitoformis]